MRLNGTEGDPVDKASPGYRLEKARAKFFSKEFAIFAGLRQYSAFTAWEPTLGGKFPRKSYDIIIESTEVRKSAKWSEIILIAVSAY